MGLGVVLGVRLGRRDRFLCLSMFRGWEMGLRSGSMSWRGAADFCNAASRRRGRRRWTCV